MCEPEKIFIFIKETHIHFVQSESERPCQKSLIPSLSIFLSCFGLLSNDGILIDWLTDWLTDWPNEWMNEWITKRKKELKPFHFSSMGWVLTIYPFHHKSIYKKDYEKGKEFSPQNFPLWTLEICLPNSTAAQLRKRRHREVMLFTHGHWWQQKTVLPGRLIV